MSDEKKLFWLGNSKKALIGMPEEIRGAFGYALHLAQCGEKHPNAKPLRGFAGSGVLEVVESDSGGTYRAVYTVKIENAVYVLHCFQKKSKSGIATPKQDMDLVNSRLKLALDHAKE